MAGSLKNTHTHTHTPKPPLGAWVSARLASSICFQAIFQVSSHFLFEVPLVLVHGLRLQRISAGGAGGRHMAPVLGISKGAPFAPKLRWVTKKGQFKVSICRMRATLYEQLTM